MERHLLEGRSAVLLHTGEDVIAEFPGSFLRMTEVVKEVQGREVRARRDVRRFIWDAQKTSVWKEPGLTLWTTYDEDRDVTLIGLGITLPPVGVQEDDVTVRVA